MLFDRTQDQSVEVLEVERNRLQNSCRHLQRSNAELQTAIQDVGPDSDFEQAIEENILTIARQQAKVERLDREIEEAKSSSHQLEPVPTGNAGVFPAGQASAINHDPPRFILAAGLQRDAFDQHHMSTEAIRGNSQQSQGTSLSHNSLNCSSLLDAVMTDASDASEAAASQRSVWL
ncbi:TPA: hypothetical protein ACH3X1_004122 [Trebouxia sp. C0004]